MPKNPYLNALCASAYIVLLVSIIWSVQKPDTPDTILIPMTMLSLFVLSAAVMGYLFILQPAQLYLDGKKQEAISFFLKTVGTFACLTAALLVVAFVANL